MTSTDGGAIAPREGVVNGNYTDVRVPEHGATVYFSGRHGCWATCLCGWESKTMRSSAGASVAWSNHVEGVIRAR